MAQSRGDLSQALRHSITPWISPQLISESDLDSTASVRASREYSWSNPTKVRYCLTGNSKRLVKLAIQPGESISYFLTIEPKTTSWEWTWLANFSRWVTRGHEGMPIISQAVSTLRGLETTASRRDHEKAQSAKMFYQKWKKARDDKKYLQLRSRHRKLYETQGREPRREISTKL